MDFLNQLLKTCGLNQSEQEVLLCLLKNGSLQGSLISKILKLKRTTVYSVLSSLEKENLVFRERVGNSTYFCVIKPEQIVETLRIAAKKNYDNVKDASEQLKSPLKKIAEQSSKVRLGSYTISSTSSKPAINKLLTDILIKKDFCSIFDVDTVTREPEMKDILKFFLIETQKNKNNVRDIVVEGDNLDWYLSKIKNNNHKVKYVPRDYRIPTDIILSDGNVFQTSYEEGREMVVQIRHGAYYKTMLTVFDLVWNFLPKEYNLI